MTAAPDLDPLGPFRGGSTPSAALHWLMRDARRVLAEWEHGAPSDDALHELAWSLANYEPKHARLIVEMAVLREVAELARERERGCVDIEAALARLDEAMAP